MEGITVTKISLESWYKDRSQVVKWWNFLLDQRHSELWAAEVNDGSTATSLLIPKQSKATGRKWGLRGNSILSIPWRELMPNSEKPLRLKKRKKGKATNPSLKISRTPTAPYQMHSCLERPPLFLKVSRKTVEKCKSNTEASEGGPSLFSNCLSLEYTGGSKCGL